MSDVGSEEFGGFGRGNSGWNGSVVFCLRDN